MNTVIIIKSTEKPKNATVISWLLSISSSQTVCSDRSFVSPSQCFCCSARHISHHTFCSLPSCALLSSTSEYANIMDITSELVYVICNLRQDSGLPEFGTLYVITMILKSILYLTGSQYRDFMGPVIYEKHEI